MGKRGRYWAALAAAVVAAGALAGTVGARAEQTPNQPPYVVKFSWGTFKLSPRIAEKLRKNQTLNIVLSMEGLTIPVYGPQYQYGFGVGIEEAQKQYGFKLKGKITGPASAVESVTEQINQIRSLLAANQLDCLTVEGGSQAAFAPIINQVVAKGIPVFTTGTDIPGTRRFATFHTDWVKEGGIAAQASVDFFKKKGITLKVAMLHTGAISQQWAQDRMNGFFRKIKQLVPGIQITNTPKDAINTGFDASQVYSQIRAYLQGHEDVQLIYQTDVTAEIDNKAIQDLGRFGKVFTVGHNVSLGNLAGIQKGVQIGTIDQDYLAQSSYAAKACSAFFTSGQIFPNTNVPVLITTTNLALQRAKFIKTTQPKR